jgi:opacity protein-like surface antigen
MMRRLHTSALTALVLVFGLSATAANAQAVSVHADGDVGLSSFHADGLSKSHVGWGASVGADLDLGGFFVGGEGTFWWAPAEVHGTDGPGHVDHKTFQEWGLGVRAGVVVMPGTKIYGKVAYVTNEQRKRFTPFNPINGLLDSSLPSAYYDHYNVHGIQWGAGVQQNVMDGLYVKAEARYSRYGRKQFTPTNGAGHSHTLTGLLGIGYEFGAAAAAPPPPPPPPPPPTPPPPPATQTCPDGSVIPATDACPPPPPPPPPPPVERGERGQ